MPDAGRAAGPSIPFHDLGRDYEALREKIDSPLPLPEQEALKELQVEIQVLLGITFTGECQEAGRQLSRVQAIDYARRSIAARI